MQSEWVRRELAVVAGQPQSFIFPVILEDVADLPDEIRSVQWIDARRMADDAQVGYIVSELVRAITLVSGEQFAPGMPLKEADLDALAQANVAKVRGAETPPPETAAAPDSVFIVHGHDLALLGEVEGYISELGIKPIVLTQISNGQQSLLQKFLTWSREVRFAVVLISADDRAASRRQFDPPQGVGERALQFRARQNVILELGFFYGYLGWEHVFVLYKSPDEIFPNFERPSDLDGVVFDEVEATGRWKSVLAERLRQAGFKVNT